MGDLTASRLRELLTYDPTTGAFTRRIAIKGNRAGSIAGSKDNRGYWVIRVDYRAYQAHRLAFLYMTGKWPPSAVDHINSDPLDNSWANLRPATWSQNLAYRGANKNNTSGAKGVWRNKRRNKWAAGITVNRRAVHLGYFDTVEEASAAYAKAADKHFGKFARAS